MAIQIENNVYELTYDGVSVLKNIPKDYEVLVKIPTDYDTNTLILNRIFALQRAFISVSLWELLKASIGKRANTCTYFVYNVLAEDDLVFYHIPDIFYKNILDFYI